jgi:hypothetical protein
VGSASGAVQPDKWWDSSSPSSRHWVFRGFSAAEIVTTQSADALALRHLDALLSLEAGAMGVTKDTRMRDLFFASMSSLNG